MTDSSESGDIETNPTLPDGPPTAYGGATDVNPHEPGHSIGQVPDADDANVDEAGDRAGPGRGDVSEPVVPDIDTSGTTANAVSGRYPLS